MLVTDLIPDPDQSIQYGAAEKQVEVAVTASLPHLEPVLPFHHSLVIKQVI